MDLNKTILAGRLTADPEVKFTQSGLPVVTFAVAVNRRGAKEKTTDFINCVAWRQTAEFIGKYFAKGSGICVCGQIQMRNFTDKNGNNRQAVEVVADDVTFTERKQQEQTANPNPYSYSPEAMQEVTEDDDLPFD